MSDTCPMTDNIFNDAFFANPYDTYTRLRATSPVRRISLADGSKAWFVMNYDDVRQGLRDPRLARNRRHAGPGYKNEIFPEAVRNGNIIMEDGGEHARLRRVVTTGLTPHRIEGMRPRVEQVVDELLDAVDQTAEVDLMAALAAPLPITIIADVLGIPERHRTDFRTWSDAMFGSDLDKARAEATSLLNYVAYLIELKRESPSDDLISHCITAEDDDGRHLTDNEILGMVYFTLIGGYDTTVGMIGTTALGLLRHPQIAERLRSDDSSVAEIVEELMRWDGCLQVGVRRFATEALSIEGTHIAAGDTVLLSIGAASRDPEQFHDPDRIDVSRLDKRHLMFGYGPHVCLGAALGRMEVSTALRKMFTRFPSIKLAVPPHQVRFRDSYVIRTPLELPVTLVS